MDSNPQKKKPLTMLLTLRLPNNFSYCSAKGSWNKWPLWPTHQLPLVYKSHQKCIQNSHLTPQHVIVPFATKLVLILSLNKTMSLLLYGLVSNRTSKSSRRTHTKKNLCKNFRVTYITKITINLWSSLPFIP